MGLEMILPYDLINYFVKLYWKTGKDKISLSVAFAWYCLFNASVGMSLLQWSDEKSGLESVP